MVKLVIEGTSSSGKSSIVSLMPDNFYKTSIDELSDISRNAYYVQVPNDYVKRDDRDRIETSILYDNVAKVTSGKRNFVFDTVPTFGGVEFRNSFMPKDVVNVLIYTSFVDLARNMNARKNTDVRGKFVFRQYTKLYTIVGDKDEDPIDTINISIFIEALKGIKYEFENEEGLVEFAKQCFEKMNINDKNDHPVYPIYKNYGMIIDTRGKTAGQCAVELLAKYS